MHKNPSREEIKKILERASTVAVVGLSDNPYRTSHAIAQVMQHAGYKIFPVNPNLTGPVLGEEPYATVEEIPERVDIVNVFRRSEKVVPTAEDAVAAGAKVLSYRWGAISWIMVFSPCDSAAGCGMGAGQRAPRIVVIIPYPPRRVNSKATEIPAQNRRRGIR